MGIERVKSLLADKAFLADLINVSCQSFGDVKIEQIDPAWIDFDLSRKTTELYKTITHENTAFLNTVLVVVNPECVPFPYCINDNSQRPRYILLSIIPDISISYQVNLPLLQQVGVVGLEACELSRSTILACEYAAEVLIARNPPPPLLCNARIEWVSIYIGKKGFEGLTKLSRKCEGEDLEGLDFDCHLVEAREKTDDPFLQKLIQAFDEEDEGRPQNSTAE